jgi:2,3-dihydroxybiphenyl 1,2-dioxygenase
MAGREIEALGYVGIDVSDLDRWTVFARDILGLVASGRGDGTVDIRLDAYATRLRLIPGSADDLAYCGWEVGGPDSLAALAGRLERAGVAVERPGQDIARDRCVAELIRFRDPEGAVLEAYYGPLQLTDRPAISALGVRFKTGRQGLGHIVLSCRDKPVMMAFYCDLLGFRLSDHIDTEIVPGRPLALSFLRCNTRHHSLALAPLPIPKKIVHLMVEVLDIDDVGRALDRCLQAGIHLSFTLGRHSNDEMLSFYPLTPSGFDIEYGWGGLAVDDESWHVLTHRTNSSWGHKFQRPPRNITAERKSPV